MSGQPDSKVMICRSAREPILPGARTGVGCTICSEPLQITEDGMARMQLDHFEPLCNACGLIFATLAEEMGAPVCNQLSRAAKAQLDRGNNSRLANWARKHIA